MQLLEISVLAQFAISASALAVSESPISLIKARATPVASTTAYLPEPSPSPIGYHSCSGYWTWSPSEWANFWKGDAAPLGTCVDNKPNNSDGTDIVSFNVVERAFWHSYPRLIQKIACQQGLYCD